MKLCVLSPHYRTLFHKRLKIILFFFSTAINISLLERVSHFAHLPWAGKASLPSSSSPSSVSSKTSRVSNFPAISQRKNLAHAPWTIGKKKTKPPTRLEGSVARMRAGRRLLRWPGCEQRGFSEPPIQWAAGAFNSFRGNKGRTKVLKGWGASVGRTDTNSREIPSSPGCSSSAGYAQVRENCACVTQWYKGVRVPFRWTQILTYQPVRGEFSPFHEGAEQTSEAKRTSWVKTRDLIHPVRSVALSRVTRRAACGGHLSH